MTTQTLVGIVLVLETAIYVLLTITALRRGVLRERSGRWVILYAAASALWVLAQLAWRLGWLDPLAVNALVTARLAAYGLVLLACLFLCLTRAFLRLPGGEWGWGLLGVMWVALLALADGDALPVPEVVRLPLIGWGLERLTLVFGLNILGWGLFMAVALLLAWRAIRRAELPLHRNRITYWLFVWLLTAGGDLTFLAGYPLVGGSIRLLGTVLAAYVALTHRLPDVRQTTRRIVSYTIITLLTIIIYTAGFYAVQYFFQNVPGYDPLWAGAVVALVLAVLFTPLLRLIERLVNHLIAGPGYDPSRLVREYSLRISNIVSLERLATLTVELIGDALQSRYGALFTVHPERDAEGRTRYRLRGVGGVERGGAPTGILTADSPVTHFLRDERRPVTQYDIDLLPAFQSLAEEERAWLAGLDMDVYVPIHSQGAWIGLLALGSKRSGDRYFDEDLNLLNTLADQTAVALENARLVEDLIEINQELEEAYAELERTHRQLQEADRLKSAFIGVITHELRSPFANIAFSLQIFQRYGLENLTPEQREQFDQLLDSLQQAKTMVDNLIAFASLLSKQGELTLTEVDFQEVLRATQLPLQAMIESKSLRLRLLLPEELPTLRADRDRLTDAVHHLLHNAIKFTPEGGEIWLRCRVQGEKLLFEVEDTGIGIPAERLDSLWEGFAQMADPLRRGVEGLGLGLALVKYIVTAHGGRVWAESQEGVGSTFGFELPLAGPKKTSEVIRASEA